MSDFTLGDAKHDLQVLAIESRCTRDVLELLISHIHPQSITHLLELRKGLQELAATAERQLEAAELVYDTAKKLDSLT